MEILNVYQNKFQTIKDENNQIIQILQKNQSKKKLIEEKNQFEFIKDKKEHNIQKKNVELNSKILLVTKNIKKINKEINELQKDLDKINITYNIKKLDNDKFRETWVSFYNDIKNKKIIVKKDETVTEEELKYIDRFGKIPEIENLNLEEKSDKNESDIIILNAT
jgi:MarR-like DNA-binding transcriptional regulator SgrR of sgrS sRNA